MDFFLQFPRLMKRFIFLIPVASVITILYGFFLYSSWGGRIEPIAADFWSLLDSGLEPGPDVPVILAMDETSYGSLNFPLNQAWPRGTHAKLLRRLAEAGAKRVVFDVLFLGEGPSKSDDDEFARSIALLPVVLGADSIFKDFASGSGSYKIEQLLKPYEPLERSAEMLGLVGFPEDYGKLRRFLRERTQITRDMPSLSEAASGIDIKTAELPDENDLIRYYGRHSTIPTFPYSQVIDPQKPLPAELLKDKVIFVGLVLQTDVGPSQKDVFLTSFGRIYGTEIHATAALNLLRKDWIRRGSLGLEIGMLTLAAFLSTLTVLSLRPLFGLIITAGTFVIWCVGSYLAFTSNIFVPGLSLVTFVLPFTLLLSTLYFYFVTRKSELKMQSAFELYLSPEMAKEVASNPASLALGGQKIWATALFTDIEGFSSISEEMPAESVAAMLNAYFSDVMNVIFEKKGTLIKFIGDAVFALWGAPVKINNHAEKACETALAIQKGVQAFNASGKFPPLNTRVGVHTGPMVVGNLGSSRRFDYTAIGDSVNLASRIEGVNKQFGSRVLISETTRKEIGNTIPTLPAGAIVVAGKKEAIELHFLLEQDPSNFVKDTWNEALKNFRLKRFEEAKKLLNDLKGRESWLDKAVALYLKQIERFGPLPPPADWQGELSFSEK